MGSLPKMGNVNNLLLPILGLPLQTKYKEIVNIMKKLSFLLLVFFALFSGSVSAKDKEQDFSQTKISWNGAPEYEFKLIECRGSSFTSTVYMKFSIKHNLANQYLDIYSDGAFDRYGEGYYVYIFGKDPLTSSFEYCKRVKEVLYTDQETIISINMTVSNKISCFDSVRLNFSIDKPVLEKGFFDLEFINVPIEWKFL